MTNNTEAAPSMDQWLKEAERLALDFGTAAYRCGDYPGGSAHAYAKRDAARAAAFAALFAHLRASPGAAPTADTDTDTEQAHVARAVPTSINKTAPWDTVPPSAAEWFADSPGIANHDWRGGWDACRNRCRELGAAPDASRKK